MPAHYIEKEIKFKINNPKELISRLKLKNAKFLGKAFQKTVRMDTEDYGLEKKGKFLRVRTGFSKTITLKKKLGDNINVREREEIEIKIEDTEKMEKILFELGFTKKKIMEKYRMNWKFGKTDISIDEMPFGFYAEVEGDEGEILKVADELNFDINAKILLTYWDIFKEYKERNNLDGEDIIFPQGYESLILAS